MRIQLPEKVNMIINRLQEHGYEAYAVGGCVRDSILGRVPDDWDITTSAKPLEIKKIFKRTIDTGIQHGTLTIMNKNHSIEITTYRIEQEYINHRTPSSVTFTRNIHEDLKKHIFILYLLKYPS